jgi:selenide,water dikinase
VYQINAKQALVQTVDFFTPIVDDPFWFGQIAAANSLSDVYAMGGEPLTALNILCFPEELGPTVLKNILNGALKKLKEAKCTLVGGHSVDDRELKFGLSVTGMINPKRIFSNDKLKAGQVLVLTKKLGTGIISTAAKFDDCPEKLLKDSISQMATLNKNASNAMLKTNATACTDITGFGFLGHLSEMTRASRRRVKIFSQSIPFFEGVESLIAEGYVTKADKKNQEYAGDVKFKNVNSFLRNLLFDPQTSGGLLVSLASDDVQKFQKLLSASGGRSWVVGEVGAADASGAIIVD